MQCGTYGISTWTYKRNKQLNINTGQMIAQSIHEHKLYRYYGQLIPIKENININN